MCGRDSQEKDRKAAHVEQHVVAEVVADEVVNDGVLRLGKDYRTTPLIGIRCRRPTAHPLTIWGRYTAMKITKLMKPATSHSLLYESFCFLTGRVEGASAGQNRS